MKIYKQWNDLPKLVVRNLDIASNYPEAPVKIWTETLNNLSNPFNGSYDCDRGEFCFASEAHYNWFVLRWS